MQRRQLSLSLFDHLQPAFDELDDERPVDKNLRSIVEVGLARMIHT